MNIVFCHDPGGQRGRAHTALASMLRRFLPDQLPLLGRGRRCCRRGWNYQRREEIEESSWEHPEHNNNHYRPHQPVRFLFWGGWGWGGLGWRGGSRGLFFFFFFVIFVSPLFASDSEENKPPCKQDRCNQYCKCHFLPPFF